MTNFVSINIISHPAVVDMHTNDPLKNEYLKILFRKQENNFRRVLGSPNETTKYSGNIRNIWVINFLDYKFFIYSDGNGTSYDVVYLDGLEAFISDTKAGEVCKHFLRHIYEKLTPPEKS